MKPEAEAAVRAASQMNNWGWRTTRHFLKENRVPMRLFITAVRLRNENIQCRCAGGSCTC